ncbi:hypothetical protein [Actibacterium sp. MT2.3-13A]|uniref:hypothetical protein n=1 Tax=Actibacterium sp. MT2.3-13A TaxID=2828332 RepID=UPI001BAB2AA3|nr:hypothetical protein [Actibacterium sp. MT2.3-13A]
MSRRLSQLLDLPATPPAEPMVLLVGLTAGDLPGRHGPLRSARLETLPYILLHAALALAPWADCVVSPLVSDQFDALDLAWELEAAGYRGRYYVVAPPLPRADLVLRELNEIAPRVQVEFLPRVWH